MAAATILSCSPKAPPSTRAVSASRSMGQSRRGLENTSCQPEASFSLLDRGTSSALTPSPPHQQGSKPPVTALPSTCSRQETEYRPQRSSCGVHTPGAPFRAPPATLRGRAGVRAGSQGPHWLFQAPRRQNLTGWGGRSFLIQHSTQQPCIAQVGGHGITPSNGGWAPPCLLGPCQAMPVPPLHREH